MSKEQITLSAKEFDKIMNRQTEQEVQIKALIAASDRNRYAKALPKEERGTQVKVWVYVGEEVEKPTLIKSWSNLLTNSSRVEKDKGVVEDQSTEITLDVEEDYEIKKKRSIIARTNDKDKLAVHQADLDKLLENSVPTKIELDYLDFAVHKTRRESVKVKGTKTMNGISYVIFDWEGQEKEIDLTFIN